MSNDSFLARVEESGHRARIVKIAKKDCPLAIGSDARRAWIKGWNRIDAARKEKP